MTEAPRDVRVAAPVGVEPEGVQHEPGVVRRERSHARPLEARGQGNVHPGVPRRDLQVAVEHTRLLRQEAVGQRLPPLDRVRRPVRRTSSFGFGASSSAAISARARRVSGTCGAIGSRGSSAGKNFTIAREGVFAADVCGEGSVSSLTCRSRKTLQVRAEMRGHWGENAQPPHGRSHWYQMQVVHPSHRGAYLHPRRHRAHRSAMLNGQVARFASTMTLPRP